MLSLRTRMGLTQAGLADLLQISRHAVGEWEAGLTYPKAHHLQHFVALCVQSLRLRTRTGGSGDPRLVENGASTGVPR